MHRTQKLPIKKLGQPLTSGYHHFKSSFHLSPQPETISPRPPQQTLRFQRNADGAAGIQNTCAQKTCAPGHMGRPRRQRLVPRPRPSPLWVLTHLHFGDTWITHRRHCTVVSHQGTYTNVLVHQLSHRSSARFNRSAPITVSSLSNLSPLLQ